MKYLTKVELATLLRVSVRTITTYLAQGRLPQPLQLGRKLLWREDVVVHFLQPRPVVCNQVQVKPRRGRPRKLS
jgi:predicted DNA-binding transcriptional regulator AlpA